MPDANPAVLDARIGVVHQLWADDPPPVWHAARRLRDSGLDRDQTIEQPARLWRRHGPTGELLSSGTVAPGPALEAYQAALASAGCAPDGRSTG